MAHYQNGNIEWYLKEIPAVFGNDIHLVCKLPNDTTCCRKYNRKWNVDYTLAVMNGLSLNETKFSEELNEVDRLSILTIKSFNEGDINKLYECVYGFWEYISDLKLNNTIFEYHPKIQLPVEPTINGNNVSVNVVFSKVYPLPVCTAMMGTKNMSSYLNVTNKRIQLLYQSNITLAYAQSEEECKGFLKVICRVGTKELKVVDTKKTCDFHEVFTGDHIEVLPPSSMPLCEQDC
ncbi:Hypothetical predicted protein [Mytilus galloprovincialis]|uniref:Uncharacterized protein n=1 Tax=Mytilus galloprovincialis TaxID=29158 RepID=A0A8B6EEK9_MYTGA|nr:Hypothetical predicted protein [Mytilus galloprovincialis]